MLVDKSDYGSISSHNKIIYQ